MAFLNVLLSAFQPVVILAEAEEEFLLWPDLTVDDVAAFTSWLDSNEQLGSAMPWSMSRCLESELSSASFSVPSSATCWGRR